jgi:hypothetical protein
MTSKNKQIRKPITKDDMTYLRRVLPGEGRGTVMDGDIAYIEKLTKVYIPHKVISVLRKDKAKKYVTTNTQYAAEVMLVQDTQTGEMFIHVRDCDIVTKDKKDAGKLRYYSSQSVPVWKVDYKLCDHWYVVDGKASTFYTKYYSKALKSRTKWSIEKPMPKDLLDQMMCRHFNRMLARGE